MRTKEALNIVVIAAVALGGVFATSVARADATIENEKLRITFAQADGSLTVTVKDTNAVWTQAAPALAFQASAINASATSIGATLTRGGQKLVATMNLAPGASEFTVSLADPTATTPYIELPEYPYGFTLPTSTTSPAYYVQNTSGDGALFGLGEAGIVHMFDFMGVPWWGVTDFDKGMMAILETPYRPAEDDNARSAVLLNDTATGTPLTLRYVFFSKAGYVEMARYYRDYFLAQNPMMKGNTLTVRSSKPGFANLKDGVYAYFWEDARSGPFLTSVHDAGITHAVSTMYYGSGDMTDAQLATMFTAAKAAGWTAGVYTDPNGNLDNIKGGHWVNDLLVGAQDPVAFYNATDQTGWDHICAKYKQTQQSQTSGLLDLFATLGVQLTYFDTYVVSFAPCLDPSHTGHNALASYPAPLPSPYEEQRQLRIQFLDTVRQSESAVGSGEGDAPAWAMPHLDFFEGSMMLRTYGENEEKIPSGGYGNDFSPATNPPPAGLNTDEQHRIPLLELMFHDYVVSTWNWRNTNFQYLGTSHQKDLLNALYGTMPMWNVSTALWGAHEQEFLDSYAFQQRARSLVGFDDMIGHGWLSTDRKLQYTDWASGIRIIANFDTTPRTVDGQTINGLDFVVVLPPNGQDGGVGADGGSDIDGGGGSGPSAGCSCELAAPSDANYAFGFVASLLVWSLRRRRERR